MLEQFELDKYTTIGQRLGELIAHPNRSLNKKQYIILHVKWFTGKIVCAILYLKLN